VTAAASVSFYRPEFADFLYTAIGTDRNEMPLTVLSALSRLDVDPWEEAAELSELPKDSATRRLASLIARLPGGRWPLAEATAIADPLIELLPRRRRSRVQLNEHAYGLQQMIGSPLVLICAALSLAALMIAATLERPRQSDDVRLGSTSATRPAK
jgi:hypothetical protein